MKKVIKNIIVIAVLFVSVFISIIKITDVLCIKSYHGLYQAKRFYIQPNNTIDIVFMGTSHVHCDINTALLWEKYKIAAYDLSGAEQPLWMTYYYLKDLYKTQNPQLIVLDLFGALTVTDEYHDKWISENVFGMEFSLNKVEMMYESIPLSKIPQYFPTIWANHGRYNELNDDDYNELFNTKVEKASFKGYTPYFETEAWEKPVAKEVESVPILEKSEEYLIKIINYARANNSEIWVIVAPYIRNEVHDAQLKYIETVLKDNNVKYVNYNDLYDEIGLDFNTDFNDWSHLNYYGSSKFTDYLAQNILNDGYSFEHKSGDDAYESWELHVDAINEDVKSNLK